MLSDARIRAAKPRKTAYKLSDSGGLHALIQPHGSKLWRLAYRYGGKQKTLALGVYPLVGLREAREQSTAAKQLLAKGRRTCLMPPTSILVVMPLGVSPHQSSAACAP